jgi:DNA-binding transcriptional ArsR family regulator
LSHHFTVLKQAELVRTERRGRSIVYSLNTSVLEDLTRIVLDLVPAPRKRGGSP